MSQVTTDETVPNRTEASPIWSRLRGWMGGIPLVLLPTFSMMLGAKQRPWVFMWLLSIAIFAGCKWLTWWQARIARFALANWKRGAAYLLLWPGMDVQEFLDSAFEKPHIQAREWLAAIANTLVGVTLVCAGTRLISYDHPMLGGWAGMVGLVLTLHFGTFHLIALAWQRAGIPVKPIMQRPLVSCSLSELWGKRWNLGFRALSHTWVFQPLSKRFGPVAGKEDFAKLTSFNRKLMWVHGGFAVYTIIAFGAMSLALHNEMLRGDRAALVLALFIGMYWLLRIVADFAYYSHQDWPKGLAFRVGPVLLISLFVFLSGSYLSVTLWRWLNGSRS